MSFAFLPAFAIRVNCEGKAFAPRFFPLREDPIFEGFLLGMNIYFFFFFLII